MKEELDFCGSAKMQPIRDLVAKVAATNTTVLLSRRERSRQGSGGPGDPQGVGARPSPVLEGELRRPSRGAARVGAVRSREGRVHRSLPAETRKVRGGGPGHAPARRDRRDAAAASGQAAARAPGRRVLA